MTKQSINQNYENQKYFIEKIRDINESVIKKFYIGTFGCQMNVRDSETLHGILSDMGFVETKDEKDSDIIVYNTCCVRENAENKVFGNLGILKNMKKYKPDLKIILCGCMMQQDSIIEKIKSTYRHVDVIFGTFNIQRLPELLYSNYETNEMIIDVWQEHSEIVEDLPVIREKKFKASVNIMFGCNNFCTYCIVPYVRGRERSREKADIIEEIKSLVSDGVKEILLLGQNVNSYGNTLSEETRFSELLRDINEIDGLERIRFITSHPKDLSDDLILAMKECNKVCAHLHLPFQSGSTEILNKMNRRYSKEHYVNLVENIREAIPDIGISTDIIVGFPGESDEDFEDTLDVVRKCKFNSAFTFIYSKRTGTPAAKMDCQIPDDIVKSRFNKLLETVNPIIYDINHSFIGKTVKVLAEDKGSNNMVSGRTEQNTLVHFEAPESIIGNIVDIKINGNKTFYLTGELI